MKKKLTTIALAVIVLGVCWIYYQKQIHQKSPPNWKTYQSQTLGFRFEIDSNNFYVSEGSNGLLVAPSGYKGGYGEPEPVLVVDKRDLPKDKSGMLITDPEKVYYELVSPSTYDDKRIVETRPRFGYEDVYYEFTNFEGQVERGLLVIEDNQAYFITWVDSYPEYEVMAGSFDFY